MGLQTVRHNLATKNNRNSSGISKTSFITQRLSHFLTLASLYCSLQKCSSITLKQAQKCLESLRNLNLVHLKLRQHYKSTILPLKKKKCESELVWHNLSYKLGPFQDWKGSLCQDSRHKSACSVLEKQDRWLPLPECSNRHFWCSMESLAPCPCHPSLKTSVLNKTSWLCKRNCNYLCQKTKAGIGMFIVAWFVVAKHCR